MAEKVGRGKGKARAMSEAHYAAVLLNIYSLAIGFVVAGALASSVTLVTGQPLRFELPEQLSPLETVFAMLCRIIAGPFMIMRNTISSIFKTRREPYWVMMAIVIASLWSFCQGVIILETACQIGACS